MKKIVFLAIMLVAMAGAVVAQVSISTVDKVEVTDQMFMDMAVSQATENVKAGGKPCGAVVILNGAVRSAGKSSETSTAEETAILKSRRKNLANAVIYTVNEPTTDAYNAICRAGVDAVYFVNSRNEVIAAGVYTAEDYDDAKIDSTLTAVPMSSMTYSDAIAILKDYKK